MTELEKGEKLLTSGNINEADLQFLAILEKDPKNIEAINNLGVICDSKGEVKKAEEYFLNALNINNDYLNAILNLASLYQREQKWESSIIYLEKALTIENNDYNIYNLIGVAYSNIGNNEKAKFFLSKSIELNPKQDAVLDWLKSFDKMKVNPETTKDRKKFNILFVQESPCIRNYKMAAALRDRGHKVSLAYTVKRLSERYTGLSDDVYNENIFIQHYRQLWDISKYYDIIHCHNEPDVLTVAALAGDTCVVHDTHDLISLRSDGDSNLAYFEGIANRGSDGRVYSTSYQLDEAKKLYGVTGTSLVFNNFTSASDLPQKFLPKLSDKDGKCHIVYEGGVGGIGHRDFTDIFIQLAKQGIHIHIYPASYNNEQDLYFSQNEYIHYNRPVSPKRIMEEMTQYDFGIIPFNIEKGNKRFLDSTIANKLFEYLAAGLPVITSPLKSYTDYFQQNKVGITFNTVQDIIDNIDHLKEMAKTVDFSKQVYTFEGEIHSLEKFYEDLINKQVESKTTTPDEKEDSKELIPDATDKLIFWLEKNGWDGYDPYDIQDYFIQKKKSGSPVSEQKKQEITQRAEHSPIGVREELGIEKKRNAKALGLLTTSWCRLYKVTGKQQYLDEAKKLAEWLIKHPSEGYKNLCWGYPFDWQSVVFIPMGTPSAVVSTTVGYGMWELYTITRQKMYLDACLSICRFITEDLKIDDMGDKGICFSYTPIDDYHIHNANLFCGEFLARIGREIENKEWCKLAERTVDYALAEQNEDGSLYYWGRIQNQNSPNHLDHYHTGFEIRCLFHLAQHLQLEKIKFGYLKYLKFYLKNYLLPDGTPKINPANAYPVNIHGAAEGVLMLSTLSAEHPKLLELAQKTLEWTIKHMQTSEGWFGHLWSPNHRIDAPYLRWGQAWMLRAISEFMAQQKIQSEEWGYYSLLTNSPGRKAKTDEIITTKIYKDQSKQKDSVWDGVDVEKPIMIVGVGRSGTTLIQSMLNAHPEICFPPESHFIRDFIANNEGNKLYSAGGLDAVEKAMNESVCVNRFGVDSQSVFEPFRDGSIEFSLGNLFSRYLFLYARSKGKSRIGEKDPANAVLLKYIKATYPEAKIVHIIRDPRDIILSRLKTEMEQDAPIQFYAENYVNGFITARNEGNHLFGDNYAEIYYEELITNPETVLSDLCKKIDIPYHDRMLNYQNEAKDIVTKGEYKWKSNVFKPVMKNNANKWKTGLTSAQIQIVENICKDIFPETIYELSSHASHRK